MSLAARHRLVKIGKDGGYPPDPPAYRPYLQRSLMSSEMSDSLEF